MQVDMTGAPPSPRLCRDENLPACTPLCGSSGVEDCLQDAVDAAPNGYDGEAWIDRASGQHDSLEATPTPNLTPTPIFDALTHSLAQPANSIANEPFPIGNLHLANEFDRASPSERGAIDVLSPDASNEGIDVAAALSDVNAATSKKRKPGNVSGYLPSNGNDTVGTIVKKAKKKPVNVWAKSSSRKGSKRNAKNGSQTNAKSSRLESASKEDHVCITLASKHQEKIEDGPNVPVVLSEFHKADKILLSDDKLSASSTKGYRMVRATRGVVEGAWYFEVLLKNLGPSGHTRLGWSTQKGEIQAPVGFDNHSYAYRDVDGCKIHLAIREPYGEPHTQGDVIGFYINLPNGAELAPKPATIVSYRGQPYILEEKEDPLIIVPGSEITFFKNGVCQGTAFKDINAGRYFPAASMYTLPNDPESVVTFHFGPNFRFPPKDIGDRPIPQPMNLAPYCGVDTFGFGSLGWKTDTPGLELCTPGLDLCTPEVQRTGEPRLPV